MLATDTDFDQMGAEVERSLVADFPHLGPASLRRRIGKMRDALVDHLVDSESLGDAPDAIAPKDRHAVQGVRRQLGVRRRGCPTHTCRHLATTAARR